MSGPGNASNKLPPASWSRFIDTARIILFMQPLKPPDAHHLSAADGWLGLGNLVEARLELERIAPRLQNHPDVLDVHWGLLTAEKNWPAALANARARLQREPKSPAGWLHQAYALRRVPEGGLQAAWEALLPALDQFPREAIIPYNLACYACQMQQLDVARIMFHRAIKTGSERLIREMALRDPDLRPLWAEIRNEIREE
jgi:hypothetical protein